MKRTQVQSTEPHMDEDTDTALYAALYPVEPQPGRLGSSRHGSNSSDEEGDEEDNASVEDELDGFLRPAPAATRTTQNNNNNNNNNNSKSKSNNGARPAARDAQQGYKPGSERVLANSAHTKSTKRSTAHASRPQTAHLRAGYPTESSVVADYGIDAVFRTRTANSTTSTLSSSVSDSESESSLATSSTESDRPVGQGNVRPGAGTGMPLDGQKTAVTQAPGREPRESASTMTSVASSSSVRESNDRASAQSLGGEEDRDADFDAGAEDEDEDADAVAARCVAPFTYMPLAALTHAGQLHRLQAHARDAEGPPSVGGEGDQARTVGSAAAPAMMDAMDGELLELIRAYYERRSRRLAGEEAPAPTTRLSATLSDIPTITPAPIRVPTTTTTTAAPGQTAASPLEEAPFTTTQPPSPLPQTSPSRRSPPHAQQGRHNLNPAPGADTLADLCPLPPPAMDTRRSAPAMSTVPAAPALLQPVHRQSAALSLHAERDARVGGGLSASALPRRTPPVYRAGVGAASMDPMMGSQGGGPSAAGAAASPYDRPTAETSGGDAGGFVRLPSFSATSFVRAYVSDVSLSVEPAVVVTLLAAALNIIIVMFLQHHVLDTRDHLGLFLIGSYLIFSSYYMVYYFLERFSSSFRRIGSQDKKFYIIGNLLKAGILVSITPFAVYHLTRIIVFDKWESNILRNLGCIYAIPDFISMIIVKRMRWSTWIHHLCVVAFNYFSILNDYQQENVCRCVVVYAAFSSFAYCVNVLLASRFLGVSVSVARVLSFVALVVYVLCCAINWVWQVYYLRRLIVNGNDHWTVYVYMGLICLVMWDDVVLNKWLLHHAKSTAFAAAQQLRQPTAVSPVANVRLASTAASPSAGGAGGPVPAGGFTGSGNAAQGGGGGAAVVNVVHRREGVMPGTWPSPRLSPRLYPTNPSM